MQGPDHNVWIMLYESTPPLLRWFLVILSGGMLALTIARWKRLEFKAHAAHAQMSLNITRQEMDKKLGEIQIEMRDGLTTIHKRIDKMIYIFVRLNTRDGDDLLDEISRITDDEHKTQEKDHGTT